MDNHRSGPVCNHSAIARGVLTSCGKFGSDGVFGSTRLCRGRTFQVQNSREPLRCQVMTASGFTMASAERQSLQVLDSQIHNRRSTGANLGRFLAER